MTETVSVVQPRGPDKVHSLCYKSHYMCHVQGFTKHLLVYNEGLHCQLTWEIFLVHLFRAPLGTSL